MLGIVCFFLAIFAIWHFIKMAESYHERKKIDQTDGIMFLVLSCIFVVCLIFVNHGDHPGDFMESTPDPQETASAEVEASVEPILYEYPEDSYKVTDDPGINSNAKRKAKICAEDLHMSKEGIYRRMTTMQGSSYTEDVAREVVDDLDTDFKENAKITAKYYSEEKGMSKDEVKKQLEDDLFTEEEVEFALKKLAE